MQKIVFFLLFLYKYCWLEKIQMENRNYASFFYKIITNQTQSTDFNFVILYISLRELNALVCSNITQPFACLFSSRFFLFLIRFFTICSNLTIPHCVYHGLWFFFGYLFVFTTAHLCNYQFTKLPKYNKIEYFVLCNDIQSLKQLITHG